MTSIPGFLTKTYEIFNTPEYIDCCGWGNDGSTIVIKKIEQFSKNVLPKYFKHSNFQSFVRQLNMYDFRKTVQDPNHGEFLHPNFQQDRPELLPNIKRKAHHKSTEGSKKLLNETIGGNGEFAGISSSLSTASLSAAALLGSMSATHHDYLDNGSSSNVIGQMINGQRQEIVIKDPDNLSESARLARENLILRQIVIDSRHKQVLLQEKGSKVLKTFYNMFMVETNNSLSHSSAQDMKSCPTTSDTTSTSSDSFPVTVESLIDRLQYIQTYRFRKSGNVESEKIESIPLFGSEDTLSLRSIAEDMMHLVTSFKNHANDSANGISSLSGINDSYANALSSSVAKSKTAACTTYDDNDSYSITQLQPEPLQHQTSLQGQQLSQVQSFDTMASRVSAPDLMMMDQIPLHKGVKVKNESDLNNDKKQNNTDGITGGGGLVRKQSIYPSNDNQNSGTNCNMNLLSGAAIERHDSDSYSWSSLFRINSPDYGPSQNDTNINRDNPSNSLECLNFMPNEAEKVYIKEEKDTTDEKPKKRGIAELSYGSNHSVERDNEGVLHQRQRLPSQLPLNPYISTIINLYDDPNNVNALPITNGSATDSPGPLSPRNGKTPMSLPRHPEVRKLRLRIICR